MTNFSQRFENHVRFEKSTFDISRVQKKPLWKFKGLQESWKDHWRSNFESVHSRGSLPQILPYMQWTLSVVNCNGIMAMSMNQIHFYSGTNVSEVAEAQLFAERTR